MTAALLSSIQLVVIVPVAIGLSRIAAELGGLELALLEDLDGAHPLMSLFCVLPMLLLVTLGLVLVLAAFVGAGGIGVVATTSVVATLRGQRGSLLLAGVLNGVGCLAWIGVAAFLAFGVTRTTDGAPPYDLVGGALALAVAAALAATSCARAERLAVEPPPPA